MLNILPGVFNSKMASNSSVLGPAALRRLKKKKQKEKDRLNESDQLQRSQSVPGNKKVIP